MKRLNDLINHYRNCLLPALLMFPGPLYAVAASGGNYDLTKCLIGASGVNQVGSANYSAAYSVGEDVAGSESQSAHYDFLSGYFSGFASGYIGNFSLISATVGPKKILQNGFQIGVPLNASVQLVFSTPLDPTTIAQGIQANLLMDHLAIPQDQIAPSTGTYSVIGTTVIIAAQTNWLGNTVYDVMANQNLRSIDGFVLTQPTHTPFLTVLDPHEENVVLQPNPITASGQSLAAFGSLSLNLDIPPDSLSDYGYVRVSQDPLHAPLQVNPIVLQQATQRAQVSGGAYQTPLTLQEIAAYNEQGHAMSLSKGITFSISAGGSQNFLTNAGIPIRSESLSLWSLDSLHGLWVKMPDSRPNGTGVIGAVTQFSVYALMGSADGDASSVYAFPLPWRPHGSDAGEGSGQSGTESGGITFSNLPSECDIKIYSLSGSFVQQLHHSDLTGPIAQQKWNGNTSSGKHASSGVYLWRVESSTDSKNGKLMIIR